MKKWLVTEFKDSIGNINVASLCSWYLCFLYEYATFINEQDWSQSSFHFYMLARHNLVYYAFDKDYQCLLPNPSVINHWWLNSISSPIQFREGCDGPSGRLSDALSGAGKRRIFAITNYIKQRTLQPIHDWLMSVLQSIPMDGTFNQVQPLEYLKGFSSYWSYDLQAATDRFPYEWSECMLSQLFGEYYSSAVIDQLRSSIYRTPIPVDPPSRIRKSRRRFLRFNVGQPLGAYSSWPLFALSHHLLVWYAAELAYPGRVFKKYALLGDDIVIADEVVAHVYATLLDKLGVKISISKSLVSNEGVFEFAKRYRIRKGMVDISPISVKALLGYISLWGVWEIAETYNVSSFSTLLRISGYGYRSLGSLSNLNPISCRRMKQRVQRLFWIYYKMYSISITLWLGRGLPLSPYSYAEAVHFILEKLKAQQLKIPPDYLFDEEELYFVEVTRKGG